VDADFHDSDTILNATAAKELIDFSKPVALLVVALLHFLPDSDEPYALLDRYKDALAPGSVLILSHGSADHSTPELKEAVTAVYKAGGINVATRSHDEIARFVSGTDAGSDAGMGGDWELIGPGVVPLHEWQAGEEQLGEEDLRLTRADSGGYGLMAVKRR
jgi:hypothetical protein